MTTSEIRAELEQIAGSGGAVPEDLQRLTQAWQAIRSQTPESYRPIIEDRLKALSHEVRDFQTSYEHIAAVCREVFNS